MDNMDHNGCTCSTRDPWATEHRELCPLRKSGRVDAQMNLHLAKSEWKELVVELGNARRIYESFAAQKPTGSEGREHYEQKADQIGRWERALLAQLALDGTT